LGGIRMHRVLFHTSVIAQAKGGTHMEPATLTVTRVILFFLEALKEGWKTLGKGISDLAGKLIHIER